MPNYEDCVIYTIRSGDNLYVGSTCNFTKRKWSHKNAIINENNKDYNSKVYKTIRENSDEWDMKPYKIFPCQNKLEMRIEEERCRVELNADLNMQRCYKEKDIKEKVKKEKDIKEKVKKEPELNRHKTIYTCECGQHLPISHYYRHIRGRNHLRQMENIKE